MSPNRRGVGRVAKSRKRTSPCVNSLRNLGQTRRVSAAHANNRGGNGGALPDRPPQKFFPSKQQVMALLSVAVIPEDRDLFRERFCLAARRDKRKNHRSRFSRICNTPISWIASAYQCDTPIRLRHAGDMFPQSGIESVFTNEFYMMDVILNRAMSPDEGKEDEDDGDRVVLMGSFCPEDNDDKNDYKFRAMILFLPQCGVFYCARERRHEEVGLLNTLVPLDMSWLRLRREEKLDGSIAYTFGEGGYVKRFHDQTVSQFPECNKISAWKILTGRTLDFRQNRLMYRARQCSDADGPMLAPDVFSGEDAGCWPQPYLAAEYKSRFARSTSARLGGRHYASGCHHFKIPDTCWIIDPTVTHCVDIMVDTATVGRCSDRQSIVMIRNVLVVDSDDDRESDRYVPDWDRDTHLIGDLNHITFHNEVLRRRAPRGTARTRGADVGTMHSIGTHVELDNITTSPYKANQYVPERLLRNMVVSLSRLGSHCFPQVYSVIRDMEHDSGLQPIVPMDGAADPPRKDGDNEDLSEDDDDNVNIDVTLPE